MIEDTRTMAIDVITYIAQTTSVSSFIKLTIPSMQNLSAEPKVLVAITDIKKKLSGIEIYGDVFNTCSMKMSEVNLKFYASDSIKDLEKASTGECVIKVLAAGQVKKFKIFVQNTSEKLENGFLNVGYFLNYSKPE